jgi:hypothetical protein
MRRPASGQGIEQRVSDGQLAMAVAAIKFEDRCIG